MHSTTGRGARTQLGSQKTASPNCVLAKVEIILPLDTPFLTKSLTLNPNPLLMQSTSIHYNQKIKSVLKRQRLRFYPTARTKQEFSQIKKEAQQTGMSASSYLMEIYRAYKRKEVIAIPKELQDTLKINEYHLAKIGNNLNQMTHHAHISRKIVFSKYRQLCEVVTVSKQRLDILNALIRKMK